MAVDLAARLADLDLRPGELAEVVATLPPEMREVVRRRGMGTLSGASRWANDPQGYVENVLHETVWSKQREVLASVRDNERTAVPACFAPGKTHLAARIALWWATAWPVGTAQVVTTATNYRTVKSQLWPHIRRAHDRHRLKGRTNLTEWWLGKELLAFGFSAADSAPEDVQGFHAPHMLVIVDEAGGISDPIGAALESLLASGHARLVAFGNPSTDAVGTWFEKVCESPSYNTVRIAAEHTPNFTGEDAGSCRACPANVPNHPVASHLLTKDWVDKAITDYGEESPYVISKVKARFPKVVANQVVPYGWVDEAKQAEAVAGRQVKLGVDPAADGGDELAIARLACNQAKVVHSSSGPHLANAVDVAGKVLEQIEEAEALAKELDPDDPAEVVVKVDSIGIGWGVVSVLERWRDEQRHSAKVVRVNVGQRPRDPERFANQRAEMWWNGRELVQPPGPKDPSKVQLSLPDLDTRTAAQLSDPRYSHTSAGKIQIEAKAKIRARGRPSPDRAEAILLAAYEPPPEGGEFEIIV